jgi:hypothetical protein
LRGGTEDASPPEHPVATQRASTRGVSETPHSEADRSIAPLPAGVGASPRPPTQPGRPGRVELPHIAAAAYDAGLRALSPPAGEHEGPIDRRANPGPDAKREMEAIRYGFDTLDDDIATCLKQWNQDIQQDAGQVMIGFSIDAKGLQRSWVETDADVPFGPRTCIANAVYGIDWSHIVEQPVELTNRFSLGERSAHP